jgi:hypothetical protein
VKVKKVKTGGWGNLILVLLHLRWLSSSFAAVAPAFRDLQAVAPALRDLQAVALAQANPEQI